VIPRKVVPVSHILYTGHLHPHLEEHFLAEVARRKERDPLEPVIVLVGSNLLGIYLRRRLAERYGGHINVRFLTLLDLARALVGRAPELTGLAEYRAAAASVGDQCRYFAPVRDVAGFHRALAGTFRALRDAGLCTPEEVRRALAALDGEDKAADLADLFERYYNTIAEYPGAPEILAAARSRADDLEGLLGTGELMIYGFYDMNRGQRELLRAAAGQLSLTLFLPYSPTAAYAFAEPLRQFFLDLGCEEASVDGGEERTGDLATVQRHLFGAVGGPAAWDGTVKIISAPGEAREVREVAREILRLAGEGVPFADMAVLLRSPASYAPLFREIFDDLNIPYFLPEGEPLISLPGVRSFLLALGLAENKPPARAKVMEWVTSLTLKADTALWDVLTVEAGITRGCHDWKGPLLKLKERYLSWAQDRGSGRSSAALEAIDEMLPFLEKLFSCLEAFQAEGSWEGYVEKARVLLEQFYDEDTRESLAEVLEELAFLGKMEPKVSLRTFLEAFREAVLSRARNVGSYGREGVSIMGVMAARGLRHRVVFLAGLVEGGFPLRGRQDPVLTDRERAEINAASREELLPLSRARGQEEQLLFLQAVRSAGEHLVLSYPRMDRATGRERVPSHFLLTVGQALAGDGPMTYEALRGLPVFRRVGIDPATSDPLDVEEWDLSYLARGGPAEALVEFCPGLDRALRQERARRLDRHTAYDGLIGEETAARFWEKLDLRERTVSVTRLEEYATCPFRYFAHNVLGLEPWQEADALQMSPLDRGILIHDVLERFYSAASREGKLPISPEHVSWYRVKLRDVVREAFAQAGISGLARDVESSRVITDLLRYLRREARRGDGMVPVRFEERFEDLPGPGVKFRGRIDRIDASDGRVRVVDYKTGKKSKHDGLQLPVYIQAASTIMKVKPEDCEAYYHYVTSAGGFAVHGIDGSSWTEVWEAFTEAIRIILDGITRGRFFPYPGPKDENCGQCDYKALCPAGVGRIFSRKQGDPEMREFLALKEEEA